MAMWKRSKRPRSGPLLPDISLACIQGITLERDSSACTDADLVEEQTCHLLRGGADPHTDVTELLRRCDPFLPSLRQQS